MIQNSSRSGSYVIEGGTFVLPDRAVEGGRLLVLGGRIDSFTAAEDRPPPEGGTLRDGFTPGGDLRVIDARGKIVTPGLMEMHIHGAGGQGFDSVSRGADIIAVRDFLLARGITSFVPTILCDEKAIISLVRAVGESRLPASVIPGIYVEGPFINPKRRGGIPESLIRRVDSDYLRHIIDIAGGKLRIMTLAPELEGVRELYDILDEAGVTISLGHSDCDTSRCLLPQGRYSITHLFNAMSGISHRDPGLANLAFSDPRPSVEINADSVHVNRECMRLAAAALQPGRLALTSDAVVAAGLRFGRYPYFGQTVVSGEHGVRYEKTGTLMGSNKLGAEIIRSWMDATGSPLWSSVLAMTAVPARIAGVGSIRGGLLPGMEADIVIWDPDFTSPRIAAAL